MGIGGETLGRCAASLAVLIHLKSEPRRPRSPLSAGVLRHVMHMMQICQSGWLDGEKGVGFTLYSIVTHLHLHTEPGRAAVGLVMVHVSVSARGIQRNKAIQHK